MALPISFGCLWFMLANMIALVSAPLWHRRATYVAICIGIPILGWITQSAGPLWGVIFLLGGAAALRWPLLGLWRNARGKRSIG